MAYEVITLNLIPSGEVPVIHAAQYDVDRPLRFALKLGDDDFDPSGYDLEIQIRKVDNNVVTDAPASVSGNVVTFNSTEQMTACSGTNLGEIQITKDDLDIATLHFYLVVQRDVLAGGVTSETAIHNITSQIAEIVPQVIGDDYYTKDEVDEKIAEIPTFDPTNYYDKSATDALLDQKADVSDLPDMTNYYDKTATDALLDQKADVSDLPDMTNYYDKTATDALLDQKADVSDLPDMSNYYTKTEVDNKITGLYEIKTATGSIVNITDGGDDIPVRTFECDIGSNGFSQADISVCGKNCLPIVLDAIIANNPNGTWSNNVYTLNDVTFTNTIDTNGNIIDITVNGTASQTTYFYIAKGLQNIIPSNATMKMGGCTGGSQSKYAMQVYFDAQSSIFTNCFNDFITITSSYKTRDILIVIRNGYSASNLKFYPMIYPEIETDNSFAPYIGSTYTVSFGSTFSDGTLIYENGAWSIDVSGVITPITSSTRLKTISGENNIYSSTGNVSVDYFTEKSDGIAELIKAFT